MMQHLKYALRTLVRTPGVTFAAVLTLALGMGANTAIFSLINAVLLRPPPYERPEQLVLVGGPEFGATSVSSLSPQEYAELVAASRSFAGVAAYETWRTITVVGSGQAEEAKAARVTPRFFDVLGVAPQLGRAFQPDEAGQPLVVISDDFWRLQLSRDPAVLTRAVVINGVQYSVIGVLPPDARYPFWSDLWVPLRFATGGAARPSQATPLMVVARLRTGVRAADATRELASFARSGIKTSSGVSSRGLAAVPMQAFGRAGPKPVLLMLFGAVGLVLLIACVNVANVLLALGLSKGRDVAIRRMLGARPAHLLTSTMTHCLLLALGGTVAGIVLASWILSVILALQPGDLSAITGLRAIRLDGNVFAFASLVGLATGAVCSAVSTFGLPSNVVDVLHVGAFSSTTPRRGKTRLARLLVVSQIAMALLLISGALLMVRTLQQLMDVPTGFDRRNVVAAKLPVAPHSEARRTEWAVFYRSVVDQLQQLPGVGSAAAIEPLPFSRYELQVAGSPLASPTASAAPTAMFALRIITPSYFATMRIPLVRGRTFSESDGSGSQLLAIVSESLAQRFWPGEEPIGKHIMTATGGSVARQVIGVVRDVRHESLETEDRGALYLPLDQAPSDQMWIVLRTASHPRDLVPAVRRTLRALGPGQAIGRIVTLDDLFAESRSIGSRRAQTILLGAFAAVALALAVVGVYGVVWQSVGQRTQEFGLRMALGATRSGLIRMVLLEACRVILAGIALGLAGAVLLTRVLESVLFGVQPTDPLTLLVAATLLAGCALAASYLPAWRATRMDPLAAIRAE